MFGLIGHSTSFEAARRKAMDLGFDHIAEGDLDVWCSAPPQLVEHVQVTSPVGTTIEGAYIDSCFVPEMLSRFKTARRKVLNAMELAQKKEIAITALGGFTSIISRISTCSRTRPFAAQPWTGVGSRQGTPTPPG